MNENNLIPFKSIQFQKAHEFEMELINRSQRFSQLRKEIDRLAHPQYILYLQKLNAIRINENREPSLGERYEILDKI